MVTTVEELINYPFSQRSIEEQLKIISDGPPRPPIQHKEVKEFDPMKGLYGGTCEIEMWLCGCNIRNAFICWTCLLFVEDSHRKVYGFIPDRNLSENMMTHKKSPDHMCGMLNYQIFQSNILATPTPKGTEVDKFFEKNREVMERITDTVCLMVPRTSPKTIRADYLNLQSQCVKLLNFFKISDCREIDEACDLLERIPNVVSDVLSSLANLVKKEFKKELKSSSFVSVILSGQVEVHLKLSIVVRYVKNDQVCERLVGFSSINKYLMDIIDLVRQVINEFELSEKQFAISCDGVVLPTYLLNDFLGWLYTYHPKSFFVPCHFHEFHSVLQQTLSTVFSECSVFFRTLRSMKEYLGRMDYLGSTKRFSDGLVHDFKKVKLSETQFLRVIKLNRTDIIKSFKVVGDEPYTNARFEGFEALGFSKWLQEFQNVFLLELFFVLFEKTAFMNEMLSSNSPDSAFECGVINSTLESLRCCQQNDFEGIYIGKCLRLARKAEPKKAWRRLFEEIVLHVIETIQLRFRHAESLNFLGIFDFGTRDSFTISDYHWNNLSKMEYQFISNHELAAEVKVMCEHGWLTGRKSVYELVEFMHQNNLHRIFKNLFRLAEFIISLPCKPSCLSSPNTKLDSINAWTASLQTPGSESLSLICEERDCLENLKLGANFHEELVSELRTFCKNNGCTQSVSG